MEAATFSYGSFNINFKDGNNLWYLAIHPEMCPAKDGFELGQVQLVQAEPDTWVANMIGHHNIRRDATGKPPIRYNAVLSGLQKVGQFAAENQATVQMPRIGYGLPSSTWDKVETLIESALTSIGIGVTVHDF